MAAIELQVDGATLHGERRESRYPDAPVVVALHAGVADSRAFDAVFDLLEGGPTLVAYDRRGYGASPPPEADYDPLDDLVRVVVQAAPGAPGCWATRWAAGWRWTLRSPGLSRSPG